MKDIGNFLVSTVLIGAVLGLGIWRLDFDRSAPAVNELQRAKMADCVPTTELAAGTKLSVAPGTARSSSTAPTPGAAALAGAPGNAPAFTLAFVSTTAIKLDGTAAAGTSADPLRLRKPDGGFELQPDAARQRALQLRSNGVAFDVAAADASEMRFGPIEDAIYEVVLDQPKAITGATGGKGTLAAGAHGRVTVHGAMAVQTLQPLRVKADTGNAPAVLHPIRVSGQPGLSDIAVEINQPGLRVDDGSVKLTACAWLANSNKWQQAGVSSTRGGDAGNAKLLIALPPGAFPVSGEWHHPVSVAVLSSDGRYAAVGSFTAVSRPWAAAAATLIVVVLLASLMALRGKQLSTDAAGNSPWFSGLFIGADGDPSLSLWQTFVWTVITVWGLLYVFIVAGSLLTLTPEMMGLLSIAGTGSVLARWIASSSGSTSRMPASAGVAAAGGLGGLGQTPAPPRQHLFWQMLSSNGSFDLLKLQLFIFTMLIAMYVVGRIADAAAFPTLDINTLLLMGVSQGVYITGKAAGAGTVARAQALKAQFDVGAEQMANMGGAMALREADKVQVEDDIAKQATAPGGVVNPALVKRKADLAAELDELKRQQTAAKLRQEALKLEFEKAVAEIGLVIKP